MATPTLMAMTPIMVKKMLMPSVTLIFKALSAIISNALNALEQYP